MSEENNQALPNDGSPPGHLEKVLGRPTIEAKEEPADSSGDVVGSTGEVASRPDDIPEKFWDSEKGEVNTAALLKAQQDAEAALRKSQSGDNEGDGESNEGNEDAEDTSSQDNVVAAASAEWDEKGELSEGTFKALESAGISRDMVNSYIAGQQAIVSNLQSAAYGETDGAENYEKAAQWAADNLSESEVQALDLQLTSTNPEIVKQGAKSLFKLYSDNVDVEPSTIRGNANTPTNGAVYSSRAEMIQDMRSTRYRTDAGFRKEVEEKLRRSNLSGR